MPVLSVPVLVVTAGSLVATIVDIRTRRIPNRLTLTMAGVGMTAAALGISGVSTRAAVFGLMVGLALMMPGYLLGATGAGDVKLMGAIGAIVGPAMVLTAFLFSAIAGGVLAAAVAIRRKRLADTLAGTGRLIAAPSSARQEFRAAHAARRFAYGPAIAAGSIVAVLFG